MSEEFKLNTQKFNDTAERIKTLIDKMQNHKNELDRCKNNLLNNWTGKGRNEFEKQFNILFHQFTDMFDDTWTMYKNIIAAENAYIQADVDAAKQIDGIQKIGDAKNV